MPRGPNGDYTLPPGNPVITGTIIESNWANPTMADLGNEMTDSLSRTGQGGMLAPLLLLDGSLGTPSLGFTTEFATGRYLFGPGNMRDTVLGVDIQAYTINAVTPFVPLRAQNGSAANPSLSFTNENTTGRYLVPGSGIRDVIEGVVVIAYEAEGITPLVQTRLPAGAQTVPAIAFNAEQNSGRYLAGAGDIREVVLGNQIMRYTSTNAQVFLDGEWHVIDPRPGETGGGSKNILINGAFDIWQRGDGPFTTALAYTSDRWFVETSENTVQKFDWGTGANKSRSYGLQFSRATQGTAVIGQRLEAVDAAKTNGKVVTASLILDPVSGAQLSSVNFQLRYANAKDSWPAGTIIDTISVPVNGGADEVITATFAAMPQQVNNGLELNIRCQHTTGTTASWVLSEVQLETSEVKTDFEHVPVAATLQKCMRYYEQYSFADGDLTLPFPSMAETTTQGRSNVPYRVEKRVQPNVTLGAITSWTAIGTSGTPQPLTLAIPFETGKRGFLISWTVAAGLLAGGGSLINFGSAGSILIDAEL